MESLESDTDEKRLACLVYSQKTLHYTKKKKEKNLFYFYYY